MHILICFIAECVSKVQLKKAVFSQAHVSKHLNSGWEYYESPQSVPSSSFAHYGTRSASQCKKQAKCVNCGENHMPRSSDCDVWKKEKEVMKISVTQRLTYPEARKIYDQQKPEFTFSKVVSSMPKKPETKTSSTQYNVKDSEITESSKVIISRIHKQNQTNQNSTSKSSSTPAQNNKIKQTRIQNNQNK